MMEGDAVALDQRLASADFGAQVADLMVDVIEGLEAGGPRLGHLARGHFHRRSTHHGRHVQREGIRKAVLECGPIPFVRGDEHLNDGVLDGQPRGQLRRRQSGGHSGPPDERWAAPGNRHRTFTLQGAASTWERSSPGTT